MTSDNRPAPYFVGEHPALDFLNTTASPPAGRIEWLADGADLADWLRQAGAITKAEANRVLAGGDADAVAAKARSLREWFREFVVRRAGEPLRPVAASHLQQLNRLLARDDHYHQVEENRSGGAPLRWQLHRRWTSAEQLLQPIAEAIGDLLCNADFRYIRMCEGPGCTLMFYDRSKTHGRRWCSMALCGNRAKVASHRARRRDASQNG